MKKIVILAALVAIIFASCKTDKAATSTSTKKTPSTAVIPETYNSSDDESDLEGTWELVSIIGSTESFKALYPNLKPTVALDSRSKQISGTTGCNSYTGSYMIDNKAISFGNGWASTKMACEGEGENIFVERMKKANRFLIKDQNTLMLLADDVALLEFKKTMGAKSY